MTVEAKATAPEGAKTVVSVPSRLDVGAVLARNTLWNYLGFAVNLAINFALFPYAVRRLGAGPAGVWLLLGSVTGYLGLLELGIVPALMQRIASAIGRGDRAALDRTVSTAVVLMGVMMALALQIAWFAPVLTGWLRLPAGLSNDAALAIGLAIAGVALRMPLAPFQAVLLGCQRQDRCNQLWIALALTKAVATVVLLTINVGVVGIVAMEAVAHLLAGLLQITWVRHELPGLRLGFGQFRARETWDLLSFGIPVTLVGISALVIEQTDRLVIGAFLPIEDVTRYAAAWKLYALAYNLPTILIQALSPVLAHLHGAGETARFKAAYLQMTKYSAAVALPLAAFLGVASGWILEAWMGPSFGDIYPVVAVLVCSFAVTSFNHAGHSALFATNQVRRRLWVYDIPQAALNLVLSVWLVRRLGILGVALGTMIPALLMQYPFLRLISGSVGVTWLEWRRLVLATALPCLVAFVPTLIIRMKAGPHAPAIVVAAMLSSGAYAVWFWFRGLNEDERAWLAARVFPLRARERAPAAQPVAGAD